MTDIDGQNRSLLSLRISLAKAALVFGAAAILSNRLLSSAWNGQCTACWTLVSGLSLAYLLWFTWVHLDLNRLSRKEALLPTLGAGNWLSIFRGLCIGLLAGFLFSPRPPGALAWVPAALYTVSLVGDYFDGYVARRSNRMTLLGDALDMELDVSEMMVAVGILVWYGTLPPWFLFIGAAPYILVASLWLLRALGRPVYDMPPWMHSAFGPRLRRLGRRCFRRERRVCARWPIAAMTRAYVSVMLWPCVAPSVALMIGLPFAVAFTIRWVYYWLAVSAMVDPRARWYSYVSGVAATVFFRWLPLLLRGALVCLVLSDAVRNLRDMGGRTEYYSALGFPLPGVILVIFTLIEFAGAVLVGMGVLGRYAAFALLFPVMLPVLAGDSSSAMTITLLAVILILLFDTGAFSLWLPEDIVFRRRPGRRGGLRVVASPGSSFPESVGGSCGVGGCPSEEI
jgi:phosphatidylglycerophosphate synthase